MGMNLWHVQRWPTKSVGYIHPSSSYFRKSIISFQRGDRVNRSVVNGTGLHSIRGRSWASCAADGSDNHETFPLDRKDDPSYDRVETSKKKDVLESIKCERMLQKLIDWHRRYYSTIVPRNAPDAAELSEWVAEVRRMYRKNELADWFVQRLEEEHLPLDAHVDVITAKWHSNFHAARGFREAHGGNNCDMNIELAPDYYGTNTEWVEAARWLDKQRELYRRQKLTRARVRMLKEVLGIKLHRQQGKPRNNLHPILKEQNAKFEKEIEMRKKTSK